MRMLLLLLFASLAAAEVTVESKANFSLFGFGWGTDTKIAILVDSVSKARILIIRTDKAEGGLTAIILPSPPPVKAEAEPTRVEGNKK